MKEALAKARRLLEWLDAPDDPQEPAYDPVHLTELLVLWLVVIGAVYWLLWTLLVYEGGIFVKAHAALLVLLRRKTLADLGYQGAPYAMGVFEGWVGNAGALAIGAAVVVALHRAYWKAKRRHHEQ